MYTIARLIHTLKKYPLNLKRKLVVAMWPVVFSVKIAAKLVVIEKNYI